MSACHTPRTGTRRWARYLDYPLTPAAAAPSAVPRAAERLTALGGATRGSGRSPFQGDDWNLASSPFLVLGEREQSPQAFAFLAGCNDGAHV